MNSKQKCCQCLQTFKLSNPPRMLPSCQHNICTKCLKEVIQERSQFIECQFCFNKTKKKQIKLFQKNLKLLAQIKNQSVLSSESTLNSHQVSVSKIDEDFQQSIFKNQELLIPQMEDQMQKQSYNSSCRQNIQFCLTHKKSLDIICITQKKRICPHCAIFGNHKDHRFKTIIQFQEEVKQKSDQFNKILRAKDKIQKNRAYSDLKNQIVLKMQKRKQYLANQLTTNFENFIKELKSVQKSIQQELNKKFQMAIQLMNERLVEEDKTKKKFMTWEQSCQEVVNRLSKARDINQRASVFYDSSLQICKQGEIYLEQMQKSLSKVIEDISDQVNSISIKISDINLNNYASLVFPILSQKQIKSSGSKNSVDLPTQSFLQNKSQNQLDDNSFILEEDISRILTKKQPQNKTAKKFYGKATQNSFLGNSSQISMFLPEQSLKKRIKFQQQKDKTISNINRVKSNPRMFKSPDLKLQKSRLKKDIAEVMDLFVKNDLTNELDLSEYHLNNQELIDYVQKASKIRAIKSLKLQGNKLTDVWFQKMIEFIPSVSNINLSHNMLSSKVLQIIIRNMQTLKNLKIVNLKQNKILINKNQRKWTSILEEFKKQKIMISID